MTQATWIEVRLLVPARMQEEASLFLTEFSGRGVILEEDPGGGEGAVVRAFFRAEEFGAWQQDELQSYLSRLREHELYPLGLEVRQAAEDDWAEAWKVHFKPVKVTSRLVIRPPWEDYEPGPGETVVIIYPGMAFGTGRHPTTLLCLQALEQVWEDMAQLGAPGAWQVLDVGTGSGILALAAARLGAKVLAIDVDPEAVSAAHENVRLNALEDLIWVETTPLNALRQQFALILANLTAADLGHWAEALAGRTLPGGALIISGFLTQDLPTVAARFSQYGLTEAGHLSQEEWSALILRRM
jgi:ribosomal protein L11 methyltransferase